MLGAQAESQRWVEFFIEKTRLIDRLRVEMAALGEPCRRILHAFYQEGESCKEIAKRLGISQSVVKTRLHRSRVQLRKALEVHARAAGYFGE